MKKIGNEIGNFFSPSKRKPIAQPKTHQTPPQPVADLNMYDDINNRTPQHLRPSNQSKPKSKKPKKKHGWVWRWFWRLVLLFASLGLVTGGLGLIWLASLQMPDIKSMSERKIFQSTKILDRTGQIVLFDWNKDIRRTSVPLDSISPWIQKATISVEDKNFYEHYGFIPVSFIRAAIKNVISSSYAQGASTITQQVVKNTLLTGDKSPTRKLKEIVLAIKLDNVMSKEDILETYLNESPYGGMIYGVEEASQSFFGKPATDVTIAEAAYLAAIIQAPSRYSPYKEEGRRLLDARQRLVLSLMHEQQLITTEEYEAAKDEEVVFLNKADQSIKAPHFVDFIRDYVTNKYGENFLDEGGYTITTTLDYDLQVKGEELVKQHIENTGPTFKMSNASIVAIDSNTGQILTMVGSRDYFDREIDGSYNIATAKRQPGSTFKPFVYATAFNRGLLPETILFDTPTQFTAYCSPNILTTGSSQCPASYAPQNFDEIFRGPMSLRDALAQSINIPAIKTLYLAGIENVLKTVKAVGISTLNNQPTAYGLSLALGAGEVSLLELTNAYAVFANSGDYNKYTGILEIRDKNGKILEQFNSQPSSALPKQTALLINDVLSDNTAKIPAYGPISSSQFYFPGREVAAKTGTTNDTRDVWVMGYTPDVSVGVWGGNNDNTPLVKQTAGLILTPLWRAFMQEVLAATPVSTFEKPQPADINFGSPMLHGDWRGGSTYVIDKYSGKLATEYTPTEARQEILEKSEVHSILHWVDKSDFGKTPSNPKNDPQYNNWEYSVLSWVLQNYAQLNIGDLTVENKKPTRYDDVHTPDTIPVINMQIGKLIIQDNGRTSIQRQSSFTRLEQIMLEADIKYTYPITKTSVFINDMLVGQLNNKGIYAFVPAAIDSTRKGANTLKLVVVDEVQNTTMAEWKFELSEDPRIHADGASVDVG